MRESLEKFFESSRKRDLTEVEKIELEELLNQDANLRQEWKEEQALNRLLDSLPNVPLSEDFTQKVLNQTVAQKTKKVYSEDLRSQSETLSLAFKVRLHRFWRGRWMQTAAVFCLLFSLLFGGYLWKSQKFTENQRIAQSIASLADTADEVQTVANSDLEAIYVLGEYGDSESEESGLDSELWVAMISY